MLHHVRGESRDRRGIERRQDRTRERCPSNREGCGLNGTLNGTVLSESSRACEVETAEHHQRDERGLIPRGEHARIREFVKILSMRMQGDSGRHDPDRRTKYDTRGTPHSQGLRRNCGMTEVTMRIAMSEFMPIATIATK